MGGDAVKAASFLAYAIATLILLVSLSSAGEALLLEYAYSPGWMPDGSSIVCVQYEAGDDENTAIVAVSPSGGSPDTLIDDQRGGYFPMPLSDGRHIVYYRTEPYEFVIHDLDGGPPVVWPVSSVHDDYGFTLSPDDSEVLYTTYGGEIWALNLGDGSSRFIREGRSGAISPDGEWLAFGFEVADEGSIAVAPVGGGPAGVLASGWYPRWSPDGEYLVFVGVVEGGAEPVIDLYVISRDGSRMEQLTDDPEWDYLQAVSPLGDKVAVIKTLGEFERHDLWVVDVDFTSISTRSMTWGGVKEIFR
jgi:Tol biopolymer transport system component